MAAAALPAAGSPPSSPARPRGRPPPVSLNRDEEQEGGSSKRRACLCSVVEAVGVSPLLEGGKAQQQEGELFLDWLQELHHVSLSLPSFWDVPYFVRSLRGLRLEHLAEVWSLLSLTKMTDKSQKLTQYAARLLGGLLSHPASTRRLPLFAHEAAKRCWLLAKHVSSTRKTLRLFRALKDVRALRKIIAKRRGKSATSLLFLSSVCGYVSSCVYYGLDHLLWLFDNRVVRGPKTQRAQWKRWRNLFSVYRLGFRLCQIVAAPSHMQRDEQKLWTKFSSVFHAFCTLSLTSRCEYAARRACCPHVGQCARCRNISERRNELVQTMFDLRVVRMKRWVLFLDLAAWNMNAILLADGLRWIDLPNWVVSSCGAVSALLGIYKLWLYAYSSPTKPERLAIRARTPVVAPGYTATDDARTPRRDSLTSLLGESISPMKLSRQSTQSLIHAVDTRAAELETNI